MKKFNPKWIGNEWITHMYEVGIGFYVGAVNLLASSLTSNNDVCSSTSNNDLFWPALSFSVIGVLFIIVTYKLIPINNDCILNRAIKLFGTLTFSTFLATIMSYFTISSEAMTLLLILLVPFTVIFFALLYCRRSVMKGSIGAT